jgi:hypothetical protein
MWYPEYSPLVFPLYLIYWNFVGRTRFSPCSFEVFSNWSFLSYQPMNAQSESHPVSTTKSPSIAAILWAVSRV